jgi:hypothetical protein
MALHGYPLSADPSGDAAEQGVRPKINVPYAHLTVDGSSDPLPDIDRGGPRCGMIHCTPPKAPLKNAVPERFANPCLRLSGMFSVVEQKKDCSKESGLFLARIKAETRESEDRSPGSAKLPPDGATGLDPISECGNLRRKQRSTAATRFLRYSFKKREIIAIRL